LLKHRLLTAVLGIPLLIYLIYLGSLPLFLAVSILFFLGLREYMNIAEKAGYSPLKLSMYIGGFLLIGETYLYNGMFATFAFFIVFMLLVIELVLSNKINLATIAVSFFGVIYLSLLKYILLLREFQDGFTIILMVFVLTWAVDTGAYFSGRLFGNKKLAPSISPNKTWEGAIGGTIATMLVAVILYLTVVPSWVFTVNWVFTGSGIITAMILGLLISLAGQFGDLLASLLKRSANVKDSGNLLPGHGGVLDRFDSILFTAPVTFYFIVHVIPRFISGVCTCGPIPNIFQ